MNILTILLNRVYFLLLKAKNQSPFFGAVLIVSLLLNTLLDNIISVIYLLDDKTNKTDRIIYYSIWVIITVIVYIYATKRKAQIIKLKSSTKLTLLVVGIFLFTLISFIWCANINREKLDKERSAIEVKSHKKSLEGRIRKWFDER